MTEFLTQKGCHAKIKVFTQMCSVHRSIFLKRFELFLLQMKSSIFLIVLWTVMQWNTAHAYFCCNCNAKIVSATYNQPRPQGPLLIQNGGSEKPLAKAAEIHQESWSILSPDT